MNSATVPSAEPVPRARGSRLLGVSSVVGTVLVVVLEFLLLVSVYFRGQSETGEQLALAQYSGAVQAATAGTSIDAVTALTPALIGKLRSSDVGSANLGALSAAAAAAANAPQDPATITGLRSALGVIDARLKAGQRRLDFQARVIYGGLLVLASFGWMIWFRRLVARHRALQREVTEHLARGVGEQRLAALVRNSADLVLVCDVDSTVVFATPSATRILGISPEELIGQQFGDWIEADDRTGFLRSLTVDSREDRLLLDLRVKHFAGHSIGVEGNVTNLISDPSVGGLVLNLRDVSDRIQLQEQVSRQAFQDSLSGLANRQLFADRLTHALERRTGADEALVVLLCDLDDFKNVNDSLGHTVGDEVLRIMGERVRSVIRVGDTAARLGGDEFAILMEGTDLAGSESVAQRLLDAIQEPVLLEGSTLTVRASIGLAQAIPGEMTSEDALRNADVAMYLAKGRGKSGIAVYESRLHAEALERLELRNDLQAALDTDEGLVLYYQPTVDMTSFDVVGFEALIRWVHPTRGFLAPGMFIPMAEECGLIGALGSWVLRQACRAAAAMTVEHSHRLPSMAVNVAAQQLAQPGFVDEVISALTESGLESRRLTLEITEGVILGDLDAIAPRLVALRNLGVRIAIDDFGTGYSSLAYLSHLPVDVLKVDKSFVDRVTLDKQDASVTEAIIAMGRTMKMKIVAEGVELTEQAQWLRAARCDIGQGYLWSRPVPWEQARELAGVTIEVEGLACAPSGTVLNLDAARRHAG